MGNRLSRRIVLGSILKFCTEQHYKFFCNGLLQFISFMLKFTKLCNLNQNRSVVRFSHSSIRRHVNFESKDFTCFLSNLPFNLWIWSCFLHKHRVVILLRIFNEKIQTLWTLFDWYQINNSNNFYFFLQGKNQPQIWQIFRAKAVYLS